MKNLPVLDIQKISKQLNSIAEDSYKWNLFYTSHPTENLNTINNQQIQIYEILPWNQAITAIRQVLTYGQGLDAIFMNLIIILIMGIILLAISVLLFNRKISRES